MYYYWAYGMHIRSELEVPEMLPFRGSDTDLYIRLGKAPDTIPDPPLKVIGSMQMSAKHYRLELPICTYYVREGQEITIDIKPNADDKSVRLFLLANAMAAALHQRQQVALHAGAVVTDRGLVVVSGHSGAGKSTTISALRQKGFAAFADDVVIVSQQADKLIGTASYPIVKLWGDSIEKLQLGEIKEESRIREHVPKYINSFHEEFSKEPLIIKEIFFIEKIAGNQTPEAKALSGIQAFSYLKEGLYQTSQANTPEYAQYLFQLLSTIAEKVPVTLIRRGDAINSIEEVIRLITESNR
jgi:energy-coupling factor transporter ATP-binding protein EcfA2